MSYRFEMENILGVKHGALTCGDRPVMVSGLNASGKTSLAMALAAVLARNPNPAGISSAQSKAYLHDGATEGHITLHADDTQTTWSLPEGKITVVGDDSKLQTPESVGLVDFCAQRGMKERADTYERLFLPPPGPGLAEDLKAAFAGRVDAGILDAVIEYVQAEGFEAAAKVFEDRRRAAKRKWAKLTGEPYGAKKANDWRPEGSRIEEDTMTPMPLEEEVVEARAALQGLHVEGSITEAQIQEAQKHAEKLPELRAAAEAAEANAASDDDVEAARSEQAEVLKEASALNTKIESRESAIETARERIDEGIVEPEHACPHCKGGLYIDVERDGSVEVGAYTEEMQKVIIEECKRRIPELTAELEKLQGEHRTLCTKSDSLGARYQNLRERARDTGIAHSRALARLEEAERLAARATATAWTEEDQRKVDEAEAHVRALEARLARVKLRIAVDAETANIRNLDHIVDMLGPSGYRAKLTGKGRARLNTTLARIAEITGWIPVTLDDSYALFMGRRPIYFCSGSERWRAQVAMQVAIAAIKGDRLAVIDGADVLDSEQWWKFDALAKRLGTTEDGKRTVQFVVTATDFDVNTAVDVFECFTIADGRLGAAE